METNLKPAFAIYDDKDGYIYPVARENLETGNYSITKGWYARMVSEGEERSIEELNNLLVGYSFSSVDEIFLRLK